MPLRPEKNLHHLIEAFSKTDNKGCRLVLAGDTDFEDEYSAGLKKYAREQGVVLTGFIKGKSCTPFSPTPVASYCPLRTKGFRSHCWKR